MTEVFRLALRQYARPLSGKGAALDGGRWNSTGVEMLYTASNRSLAMVEVVVHMPPSTTPPDYVMLTIGIPDDVSVEDLPLKRLPNDWNAIPFARSTQILGDRFVEANKAWYCACPRPSPSEIAIC